MSLEILKKWQVPIEEGFEIIDNDTSIQLSNEDGSKVVYLSILNFENGVGPVDTRHLPKFTHEGDSYHLKGAKVRGNEVLIVVITLIDIEDEKWARDLFSSIV